MAGHTAIIAVRVKPGASRTRVGGSHPGRFGPAVVVTVTEPPVDGRATEAARRALAVALDLPLSALSLRAGAGGRDKLFAVDPAPVRLADQVRVLRDGAR